MKITYFKISFGKIFLLVIIFMISNHLIVLANDAGQKYVGYKHRGVVYGKKLPNGVRDLGGGLLSEDEYGVTRFTKRKNYMLWLEKIVSRNNKGVPNWEVKDVLSFSKMPQNSQFFFSRSSPCTLQGIQNPDLIVWAEKQAKSGKYKILKAWLVNFDKEKFVETNLYGIVCK